MPREKLVRAVEYIQNQLDADFRPSTCGIIFEWPERSSQGFW
jgi:hypothetical protein